MGDPRAAHGWSASPEPRVVGTLVGTYLSAEATGPPRAVHRARAVPGRGLEGDRLTGQPAKAAVVGRGGLRASIRTAGILRTGDPLVLLS